MDDVRELFVVAYIGVGETAVKKQAGNVCALWFVGRAELISVIVHPNLELVLCRLGGKVGWFPPSIEDTANAWMIGVGFVCG